MKIKKLALIRTVNTGFKPESEISDLYETAAESGNFRVFYNPGNAFTKLIAAHEPGKIHLMPSRIVKIDPNDDVMSGGEMCVLRTPLGPTSTKFAKPERWVINDNGNTPYDHNLGGKPGVAVMLLLSVMADTIAKCDSYSISISVFVQIDKIETYSDEITKKMNGKYIFEYCGVEREVTLSCMSVRSEGDHIVYQDMGKLFGPGNHVSLDLGGNTMIYRQYKGNVRSKGIAYADHGASKLISDLIQKHGLLIRASSSESVAQNFIMDENRFDGWDFPRLSLEDAQASFAKLCKNYADEALTTAYNRHAAFINECDNIYFLGGLAQCDGIIEAMKAHPIVRGRGKVIKNPQIVDMVKMMMTGYDKDLDQLKSIVDEANVRKAEAAVQNEILLKQQERDARNAEMTRLIHGEG